MCAAQRFITIFISGNARSTVSFDTIRRYFEYRGYDVNFVSNFTDVDDKIIRVANETGMTAESFKEIYRSVL